ncbi:natriuretic peptides B [Lepus europaeus]|uniref:natriuretic peptides B n=1 Tax=Lepus europaeus TaxID=9983 RepID=UPI002B49E52B|nr:natriuretic peptides B [Lepus europaeus]
MDLPTALSRALLLLLLLHLSPQRCRPHPLGSTSKASSELSEIQQLLGRLRDKVSQLQTQQTTLEPTQQDGGTAKTWETQEAREAAPAGSPGPQDEARQTLRRLHGPKRMQGSGCFGRRMDRIGSFSGLGCNVLRKQ